MLSKLRPVHRSDFVVSCCLLLTFTLVSCGGGTTSTPTLAPKPSSSPSLSPTSSPTISTSAGMLTYTGNGFTISYPSNLQVSTSKSIVSFSGASCRCLFQIGFNPNPGGVISASAADQIVVNAVKQGLKNPQLLNVPPTITIGGDTWDQQSVVGTVSQNGGDIEVQYVVVSDNHPASTPSTVMYSIYFGTATLLFPDADLRYFQPMLQSFKFKS